MKRLNSLLAVILIMAAMALASSTTARADNFQNGRVILSSMNGALASAHAVPLQFNDTLRVIVLANRLEGNQVHLQHLRGFGGGTDATCPTMAQDTNGDGFVDSEEGAVTYGPIAVDLTPADPVVRSSGIRVTDQTFDMTLDDMTDFVIVLFGMTIPTADGGTTYDVTMPVACGEIRLAL